MESAPPATELASVPQEVSSSARLSHKEQRKLRKKLARRLIRRHNAQLRDNSSEQDITEEEAAQILAEEELEKLKHDEEEQKWLERERIAQELFTQKKALEEAEEKNRQETQKKALNNFNHAAEGSMQNEVLSIIRTRISLSSENLPPDHCPEPPRLRWKREELCTFFWRTGACRYGTRCSRLHPIPPLHPSDLKSLSPPSSKPHRLVLILENMFDHFSLQCDPLEVDESQLLSDYFEFFSDVYPELENVCGGSLEAFRCCRNASDHLRGNVYVQFIQDPAIAMDIATRLSRRWYAGRQIVARLAYLGQGWRSAVCGLDLKGKCSKGDRDCNFLHIFLNPGEKPESALRNGLFDRVESTTQAKKMLRDHQRRGRSRGSDRRSERSHSWARRRRHHHKHHHGTHKRRRKSSR